MKRAQIAISGPRLSGQKCEGSREGVSLGL